MPRGIVETNAAPADASLPVVCRNGVPRLHSAAKSQGVVRARGRGDRAEAIVRALANIDPGLASEYACFFCGAGDPLDRPIVHDDDSPSLRATRWAEGRWERDEGWRRDALRRLDAAQARLLEGGQAHASRCSASWTILTPAWPRPSR